MRSLLHDELGLHILKSHGATDDTAAHLSRPTRRGPQDYSREDPALWAGL